MLLNELSATEAAKLIALGRMSSEELVRACLDRVAAREARIHAWVCTRAEPALEEARRKDRQTANGPLHGVPVGIKDVIETCDLPTEMGSPIYKHNRPLADAACVAAIRAAGGIVLGKTVTAEFAYVAPGRTTNPLNERHTPGGSSSGSAAAVADFMIPVALGSQTGGSVIRPASYCGIFGFKPTYGLFSRAGLKPAAESLDTIGLLARSVDDIALFKAVLAGGRSQTSDLADVPNPTIGLCRTHLWHEAAPAAQKAVESAAEALSRAGARIVEFDLPAAFRELHAARIMINNVERAHSGVWEWTTHRSLLSKQFSACIESGLSTRHEDYATALRLSERCRSALDDSFRGLDVLLTPSASGEATEGLSHTGDSTFQALWTLLHVPTLTVPSHRGPNGLPIGVQFVGPRFSDDRLLGVASWAWKQLNG